MIIWLFEVVTGTKNQCQAVTYYRISWMKSIATNYVFSLHTRRKSKIILRENSLGMDFQKCSWVMSFMNGLLSSQSHSRSRKGWFKGRKMQQVIKLSWQVEKGKKMNAKQRTRSDQRSFIWGNSIEWVEREGKEENCMNSRSPTCDRWCRGHRCREQARREWCQGWCQWLIMITMWF